MKIIIIGNGIAGITAARHIRKLSDHEILVVSSESPYFFSRTALMYVFMGHMRIEDLQPYENDFWAKNRIDLLLDYVVAVDFHQKSITLRANSPIAYDKLLIATGSKSARFGWKGQELEGVHSLYNLSDLEQIGQAALNGVRRAVITGGGLIGIELAEMLHSRHIPVTFLVRESSFWNLALSLEESRMINREILRNGIDLALETELGEIIGDGEGKVEAVITRQGKKIDCQFVGLTTGVAPNVDFLKNSGLDINKGVLVDDFLQTNFPEVYAIGDCAEIAAPQPGRKSIEPVWYAGRMMGETVAHTICGSPQPYRPGVWFNSAKFFNIEYQVYGNVPAAPVENQSSIYWEHPEGKKSIRLVYDSTYFNILGFQLMGVRYRQEVCEKWIKDRSHIENVLRNLGLANFDGEFFKQYEGRLVALYNRQTGKSLSLIQKRSLPAVIRFLNKRLS